MNKLILMCLAILSSWQLSAQNYQLINPNQETHFLGRNQEVFSIRIDSIESQSNVVQYKNHTIFFQYYNPNNDCFATEKDSSWLGDKVTYDTTGAEVLTHFYSRRHVSNGVEFQQTIKPLAHLNDTWIYADVFDGNYLEATLTAETMEMVLGVLDSVKTITLQAKDALNNNVSHIFNGQTIKWSKNHGLVKIFDIFQYPLDTTAFNLIGTSNPDRGVVNLTAREIYDYAIGDEFHTKTNVQSVPWTFLYTEQIKTVLSKNVSANQDTFSYTYRRCRLEVQVPGWDSTFTTDTLTEDIILSNLTHLSKLNYEVLPDSMGYLKFFMINNYAVPKRGKEIINSFLYDNTNDCWGILFGDPYFDSYYEGLGGGYHDDNSIPFVYRYHTLVYYEKGTETWGIPLGLSCSGLNSTHQLVNTPSNIKVYPNPFLTSTTIQIEDFDAADNWHLELIDITGKQVLTTVVNEQQFILNKNNLPSGLYLYRLVNKKQQKEFVGKVSID